MEMFEYVAVLTSIIIGLGIAHLLQGAARLIQHPGQDRVYWVHLAWVVYSFFWAIFWWWFEFQLVQVEVWTFPLYLFLILYAVLIYMVCALLFPLSLAGYDGFKDYFLSRRTWFFGLWTLISLLDIYDSWLKGAEHFSSLGPQYLLTQVGLVALFVVAARTRNERFHAFFVVFMMAGQILTIATTN